MTTQPSEDLEAEIIERLTNAESANDIILDICERTGMSWTEVERLVEHLHLEKKDEIVVAQSPLLVLLAFAIFLAGVGLIGSGLYDLYEGYISSPESFIVYLSLRAQDFVGALFLGLAMVIGSLKGMSKVWESIFEWMGWWPSD